MKPKAFVLLSGGLDSTTALYLAMKEFSGSVEAVSCDYGQRHAKEMWYAKESCNKLGIPHRIVNLGSLLSGAGIMLTDSKVEVPNIDYADIKGVSPTYVPYRNGVMLSAIAALANKYVNEQITDGVNRRLDSYPSHDDPSWQIEQQIKKEVTDAAKDLVSIYAGQHAEDAKNWAYPDCSFEFLGAQANAIYVGSYNTVRLKTPFVFMSKAQIVEWGQNLDVPYGDTWSCYRGGALHCGTCPTCRSRKQAFIEADVTDPTEYLQQE